MKSLKYEGKQEMDDIESSLKKLQDDYAKNEANLHTKRTDLVKFKTDLREL
jgi:hypothetical protein